LCALAAGSASLSGTESSTSLGAQQGRAGAKEQDEAFGKLYPEPFLHLAHLDESSPTIERRTAQMPTLASHPSIAPPNDHILTAQEALEPLFLQIEAEAEVRMIAAAIRAGWTAEDAVFAIDELRRNELLPGEH
jgi:hypothetical protein